MKLDQSRRDVIPSLSLCNETSCGIFQSLEFSKQMVRDSVEQTISVVEAQSHVGVYHYLRGSPIEKMSNFANGCGNTPYAVRASSFLVNEILHRHNQCIHNSL